MPAEDLEDRVKLLEFHVALLLELADSERNPFVYHVIEAHLTEEQMQAIYTLMDETQAAIRAGGGPTHHAFEQRVYEIVPEKYGHYHFAEGIVSTLHKNGQYDSVHEYMRQNGMNLH